MTRRSQFPPADPVVAVGRMIDNRQKGDPITETNQAATLVREVTGALSRMTTALERQIGKMTDRKGH